MPRFSLALLLLVGSAGTVLAGGLVPTPEEPVPAVAPPSRAPGDSGPYAGLWYGATSTDINIGTPTSPIEINDGSVIGVYGGYMFYRGSFAYGAELAYGKLSDVYFLTPEGGEFPYPQDWAFGSLLDAKARAGFASGQTFIYGLAGYSRTSFIFGENQPELSGTSWGIGAEFTMRNRIVFGLEYMSRDLKGTEESFGDTFEYRSNFDTLSLRVGMKF